MKYFLFAMLATVSLFGQNVDAAENISPSTSPIRLTILSAKSLDGTAGDYATVLAQITNTTQQPISDITTYLSLVDAQLKLPVDLEDWSAEKGLFIGTIDAGQTLPLNWKIHFVKAGQYTLTIVADIAGQDTPIVSTLTQFSIKPKINLNPGQVLPVALGMPLLLLCFVALIQHRRNSRLV